MAIEEHRLILRGINCQTKVTARLVRQFFVDLTKTLSMSLWKGPWAWRMMIEGKEPGISGFVAWHESGSHLHEYTSEHRVTLDVYSCKAFSTDEAQDLFERYFKPEEVLNNIPILNKRLQ